MRFGGRRTSENVEGRTQGAGGFGLGGGGGGGLLMLAPMLIRFVFSRFGIVGVIVLIGLFFLLMGNPFGGGGGQQAVGPQQGQQSGVQSAAQACASDETKRFLCQVLASTEDKWTAMFSAAGQRYAPPGMVFYPGSAATECGTGEAAMGPFYCPSDRRIYLDTSFFDELSRRHGAPGDFAQAYVIAHEVGHHVQTLTGAADNIRRAQSAVGRGEANALQVRMELQADCYAGL